MMDGSSSVQDGNCTGAASDSLPAYARMDAAAAAEDATEAPAAEEKDKPKLDGTASEEGGAQSELEGATEVPKLGTAENRVPVLAGELGAEWLLRCACARAAAAAAPPAGAKVSSSVTMDSPRSKVVRTALASDLSSTRACRTSSASMQTSWNSVSANSFSLLRTVDNSSDKGTAKVSASAPSTNSARSSLERTFKIEHSLKTCSMLEWISIRFQLKRNTQMRPQSSPLKSLLKSQSVLKKED